MIQCFLLAWYSICSRIEWKTKMIPPLKNGKWPTSGNQRLETMLNPLPRHSPISMCGVTDYRLSLALTHLWDDLAVTAKHDCSNSARRSQDGTVWVSDSKEIRPKESLTSLSVQVRTWQVHDIFSVELRVIAWIACNPEFLLSMSQMTNQVGDSIAPEIPPSKNEQHDTTWHNMTFRSRSNLNMLRKSNQAFIRFD